MNIINNTISYLWLLLSSSSCKMFCKQSKIQFHPNESYLKRNLSMRANKRLFIKLIFASKFQKWLRSEHCTEEFQEEFRYVSVVLTNSTFYQDIFPRLLSLKKLQDVFFFSITCHRSPVHWLGKYKLELRSSKV